MKPKSYLSLTFFLVFLLGTLAFWYYIYKTNPFGRCDDLAVCGPDSPRPVPTPSVTPEPSRPISDAPAPKLQPQRPVASKRKATASAATLTRVLPIAHGGDVVTLPKGYGFFTVPVGMIARTTSPGAGLVTKKCSLDRIIPPCRIEWPIDGGVMRVELERAPDEYPAPLPEAGVVDDYNDERRSRGLTTKVFFANGVITVVHPNGLIEQLQCMKRVPVEGLLTPTRLVPDPTCVEAKATYQ